MVLLYVPGLIYFIKNKEFTVENRNLGYFNLRISRSFVIPDYDDSIKNKILTYWGNRNAQFIKISEREYQAKRGSLLKNLTTFKMYKLKSTITISVSEDNQITSILNINTMFERITNWNRECNLEKVSTPNKFDKVHSPDFLHESHGF